MSNTRRATGARKPSFLRSWRMYSKIGPILEENAEENDKLGRLNDATFAALKPLRMSHIFAGEEIGGSATFANAGPRAS